MESNQIIVGHLRLAFELVHDIKTLCHRYSTEGLHLITTLECGEVLHANARCIM
jgi:hypothetical protein